MLKSSSRSKGFTLVEILVVVAIIVFLASSALISSFAMRGQLEFRSGYSIVEGLISEARNMALSGESFPDTSDYDQDEIFNEDDLILPNGYIVLVVDEGLNVVAYLYADLFDSKVGQQDNKDKLIKMVELPENIQLTVDARKKSGDEVSLSSKSDITFMYKTPDAIFSVITDGVSSEIMSLQLKLEQTDKEDVSTILRTKYVFLHYLYGIPELLNESYFQ
jgi:prepilin-type N-terminal cleavage/methylation domain-containing protein